MKTRSLAILFPAFLVVSALCGCGGRSGPTAPTGPTAARPTYTLSGVITEDTSPTPQPVAGAIVRLGGNGGNRAITNRDGFYSLGVVADNISVVIVEADGFEPALRRERITNDTRIDFQLRRPPQSSVSGFVYEVVESRQVPIADVWVQERGVEREAHTDANGNFHIRAVDDGPDLLDFSKPGYEGRTLHITVAGQTTGINVQLTRAQ